MTLSPAQLVALSLTSATDGNVSLSVSAIDKDADGDLSAAASGTETITIDPTAPTLSPVAVSGVEGQAIALDLGISPTGEANNSLYSVTLSGVPSGATLTNSNHDTLTVSGGTITFDAAQIAAGDLNGLALTAANDGSFTLDVSAQEEGAGSTLSAVASGHESVTIGPTAPTVSPVAVAGVEGQTIALDLGIGITGQPGDNNSIDEVTLKFTVPTGDSYKFTGTSGLDESFTAGADQSLTLTPAQLAGLSISTTTDSNVSLSVSAIDKDPAGDLSPAANGTETVTIDPTTPTVSPTAVSGFEGQAIALDLGISPTGEASNTIDAVTLTFAVPTGESYTFTSTSGLDEVFTAGADQTLTLTPAELAGLAITTTNAGTVSLAVSAIDKDAEGNLSTAASGNETVTVNPLSWAGDTLVEYYYYPNSTTTYYTSPTFVAPAG